MLLLPAFIANMEEREVEGKEDGIKIILANFSSSDFFSLRWARVERDLRG